MKKNRGAAQSIFGFSIDHVQDLITIKPETMDELVAILVRIANGELTDANVQETFFTAREALQYQKD